MNDNYDLIVVGGGVLGTFHAFFASKKGLNVLLLERDTQSMGATVQNFGMIATGTIAQAGQWDQFARRSNQIYQELDEDYELTLKRNGTLYLVETALEHQVIKEFADLKNREENAPQYLDRQQIINEFSFINHEYVAGGLFLPGDMSIEPQSMIHLLHQQLVKNDLIQIEYNAPVISVLEQKSGVVVTAANQRTYSAAKVVVCNGAEFQMLFPGEFEESNLQVCVLHMMRTVPQSDIKIPHNILSGLSVSHYPGFSICPSFSDLQIRASETLYKKYGIHLLFKHNQDGSITIGDSHQYYSVAEKPAISNEIDMTIIHLILDYARKMLNLNNWQIQQYWLGRYMTNPDHPIFEREAGTNIHIRTGISGKGMSTAPGYAEASIEQLFS
jgi:FAD dependent oxidoreductase TIGR03364